MMRQEEKKNWMLFKELFLFFLFAPMPEGETYKQY